MKIIKVKNYDEASLEAFKIMKEQVVNNPSSHLGLATGSTPIKLYSYMIQDHKENGTSYKDIKSFNLDEYYGLDQTHDQSYYYFMMKNLFSGIDINKDNINVPKGSGDIQTNCNDYNEMLCNEGIDLQLLGIGSNGHIGFNEPGSSFDSVTHYIELEESTRQDNAKLFFNGNIDEVPTHAITMGIKNILDAKKILLIACGINKSDAIKILVDGDQSISCPASALQNHDNVILIIDEDAASKLN